MMKVLCTRAADCESGATAIEYALTAAVLSVALLTGAETLGSAINDRFGLLAGKLVTTPAGPDATGGSAPLVSRQPQSQAYAVTAGHQSKTPP